MPEPTPEEVLREAATYWDHGAALAALDQLLQERDDTARDAALAVARISAVTIRRLRAERDEARKSVDELQDELVLLSESNARLRADLAEARKGFTWDNWIAWLDETYPPNIFTGESGDPGPRAIAAFRAALSHQGEPDRCPTCGSDDPMTVQPITEGPYRGLHCVDAYHKGTLPDAVDHHLDNHGGTFESCSRWPCRVWHSGEPTDRGPVLRPRRIEERCPTCGKPQSLDIASPTWCSDPWHSGEPTEGEHG